MNPNDPTGVVVDTSDSESGVAGGSIEMAPAGTGSWTALPTTFTGSQLLAHFDDVGLRGAYTFSVRSCDNVGNCASTARTVMLPVRTEAVSEVSLEQLPGDAMRQFRPQARCCTSGAKAAPAGEPGSTGRCIWSRTRIGRRSSPTSRLACPSGTRCGRRPHRWLLCGAARCRCLTPSSEHRSQGQPPDGKRSRRRGAARPRRGSRRRQASPLAGR